MIKAEEARAIALRCIDVQKMLSALEGNVEMCVRNCAENGRLEVTLDLSFLLPSTWTDAELKAKVVDAMVSELKMMGYHVKEVENSKIYRISWKEEEEHD